MPDNIENKPSYMNDGSHNKKAELGSSNDPASLKTHEIFDIKNSFEE